MAYGFIHAVTCDHRRLFLHPECIESIHYDEKSKEATLRTKSGGQYFFVQEASDINEMLGLMVAGMAGLPLAGATAAEFYKTKKS